MFVSPSGCWEVASGFLDRFEPEEVCEVPFVYSFDFGASFNFSHNFTDGKNLQVGVVFDFFQIDQRPP